MISKDPVDTLFLYKPLLGNVRSNKDPNLYLNVSIFILMFLLASNLNDLFKTNKNAIAQRSNAFFKLYKWTFFISMGSYFSHFYQR